LPENGEGQALQELTPELPHWTLHDLRHTGRTGMSRLRISTKDVRARVLGHVDRSVDGGYDQNDYLDEKREALELWGAAHVAKVVN
jgi:integrase